MNEKIRQLLDQMSALEGDLRREVEAGRLRTVALESFWIGREGRLQCSGPLLKQGLCLAVVDGSRRHVADTRMAVLVVVPREELLAMGSGIFDAAESRGEVGPVLDRLSAPMRCNFFATAPPPPVTRRNV